MQLTRQQQKALHVGLKLLSEALNDAGLDQRKVLKPSVSIPWTMQSAKDSLFRPIMTAITLKKSTTELDKVQEIEMIWDTLMRHLGEKHEIDYIPFPCFEVNKDDAPLINEL